MLDTSKSYIRSQLKDAQSCESPHRLSEDYINTLYIDAMQDAHNYLIKYNYIVIVLLLVFH